MTSTKKSNRLGEEKSPYLLQHKDNPVHWFAWGDVAFRAAREENKLIFLSIGYSTCYWCHMMEKDSFEIPEVAAVMNAHFINIKVDREEHPDVDQIYMDAVMAMTGRGGWPMSVILTPDLKPVFGGTFFWRAQFVQLLEHVESEWRKKPDDFREFGARVVATLSGESAHVATQSYDEEILREAFHALERRFDPTYGGFGPAPKFPHTSDIQLLLRIHRRSGNAAALMMAEKTLTAMACGGMYDQLGGGFHRYSTDAQWFAPHFEKMLYDNALLTQAYLEAYQLTHKPLYAKVAREILDYVLREMTAPQGGFYSAQDAGDVGEEGDFYVWTYDELKTLLSASELELVKTVFGVSAEGNWEHGKNILHVPSIELWEQKNTTVLRDVMVRLFATRHKRVYPRKDDKILTSWNGLMIAAMARGSQVLAEPKYLLAAQNAATFLRHHLYKDEKFLRRHRDGDSRFDGTLDDYAFVIDGLIHLFQADCNDAWYEWALALQKKQHELFWDEVGGGYYFSQNGETSLVIRKKEFHDGAIPSGNAYSLLNLLRLSAFALDVTLHKRAEEILGNVISNIRTRSTLGYSHSLMALDFVLDASQEIVLIGSAKETQGFKTFVQDNFLPNSVCVVRGVEGGSRIPLVQNKPRLENAATFYICQNNTCQAPTTDIEKAKALILEKKTYAI